MESRTQAASTSHQLPMNTESTNTGSAKELSDLGPTLDGFAIEDIIELKISRFLDQIGTFYPENMHDLMIAKMEKPLLSQILRRVGGNQVHASKILGINRNTLRKKIRMHGI